MTLALYLLPERDCSTCTDTLKKQWGCNKDTVFPLTIDNDQLWRCPRRPFLDDPAWFNSVFQSSAYHEKGMLTEPGTWLDQPAKLIAALQVVDTAVTDAQDYKKTAEERRRSNQARPSPASGGRR